MGGAGGLLVAAAAPPPGLRAGLAALEASGGGTLGFALLDTATGTVEGHRLDRMFGLCSTFKLLLAGFALQDGASGRIPLDRRIPITADDVVQWSPVIRASIGKTLSIEELARGTVTTSDNGAANILMRLQGGPEGVTARLRASGDRVTRIDRWEPEMSRVVHPDERDSSTPRAFAETTRKLVLGDLLRPDHRSLLVQWMIDTKTGVRRLRAGLPADWRVGDRTGTGLTDGIPNRTNAVAVTWPPGRAPLVVAAFYESPGSFPETRPEDEALLAEAMRIAVRAVQARGNR